MALNVFFVFQTSNLRYRAREFDTLYIIVCYGISLIPALVYLVLDLTLFKELEPFYGDATVSANGFCLCPLTTQQSWKSIPARNVGKLPMEEHRRYNTEFQPVCGKPDTINHMMAVNRDVVG
jgi:hypothetical protein